MSDRWLALLLLPVLAFLLLVAHRQTSRSPNQAGCRPFGNNRRKLRRLHGTHVKELDLCPRFGCDVFSLTGRAVLLGARGAGSSGPSGAPRGSLFCRVK